MYNFQSSGILKLVEKVKFLHVFQNVDRKNLENSGQREVTNSYFKVWVIKNPWNYEIEAGAQLSAAPAT
jgi:hypothetical protein